MPGSKFGGLSRRPSRKIRTPILLLTFKCSLREDEYGIWWNCVFSFIFLFGGFQWGRVLVLDGVLGYMNIKQVSNNRRRLDMLEQNSSKTYPPIVTPQGQKTKQVQVLIRGEPTVLRCQDFFQLTQIVNLSNFSEMKNSSLHWVVYSQNNVLMFHIFLYYCIKIDLGIEIEGLDSFYLRELGNLYVTSGFQIQIGKFAKMCEVCMGMEGRKCAHIIYYLVYGRIATSSYINSLFVQNCTQTGKKDKLKSIISLKYLTKKESRPRSPREKEDNFKENESYDKLAQDLNKIFIKDQQNNQGFDNGKEWNAKDYKQNNKNKQNNDGSHSQKKYYMNFFPNRIYNTEKSAIFETIQPSNHGHYKLMRKKKFNDQKIQKMLYMTFNAGNDIDDKQEQDCKSSVGKQKCKIFTYSAIRTNEKFKVASHELDKIRNTITKTKRKYQGQNQAQASTQQSHSIIPPINQHQKSYLQFLDKSRAQAHDNSNKVPTQELSRPECQNENTIISLVRRETKDKGREKNEQEHMEGSFHRKKQTGINLSAMDGGSKTNRIFHTECQSRLFRYKNEYRRFMKVHLFKADDQ